MKGLSCRLCFLAHHWLRAATAVPTSHSERRPWPLKQRACLCHGPTSIETYILCFQNEKARAQSLGFSVVSGPDTCSVSPSGRSCWEHMWPGQCLRGPGVPAGETLPHGAVGSRPDPAAPPDRAQHCGELPAWAAMGSLLNPYFPSRLSI